MLGFSEKQAENEFKKYSERVKKDDIPGVLDKEDAILSKVVGPLKTFGKNIKLLFSLVKDYKDGKYTEVPWLTIAAVVGTLFYIFSPIDLIPDFIPFIGLLDDAVVLGICLRAIASDLDAYRRWKETNEVEYRIIKEG
jgi:uncharacterized membrane protein YkvA (DUF1232 family)